MSQSVARVWADDLARIDLDVAVEAAQMHYRESADWLMPAHIIKCAKRVHEARYRADQARRNAEAARAPQAELEPLPEWVAIEAEAARARLRAHGIPTRADWWAEGQTRKAITAGDAETSKTQ